jgi:hypothetical protein
MDSATGRQRGPVLLSYDGSDAARRAIERAGQLLGGSEAIVLTVWESLGSATCATFRSGATEFGSEA